MRKIRTSESIWKIIWIVMMVSLCFSVKGNASIPENKIQLIKDILNDPMLPDYVHDAMVSIDRENSDGEATSLIVKRKDKAIVPGVFSIIHRQLAKTKTDEVAAFFHIPTLDGDIPQNVNWDEMQKNWTAFVNRYWPSVHRTSDWHDEIHNYSGRGVFTINYAQMEGDIAVLSVSIEVNLGDGKIWGFYETDYRNLLKGYVIPQAPSASGILSATQKALSKKTPKKFSDFKIIASGRKVKRNLSSKPAEPTTGNSAFDLVDSGYMTAFDEENTPYIVVFNYSEQEGAVTVLNFYPKSDLNNSRRQKPLTQIDDKEPSWSADGKHLYFVTSRRAKDQPWWTPVAFQYAMAVNQIGTDNLQYISPLKTKYGDYGLYQSPRISPNGHYLAAGLGSDEAYLFILDMQKGILHIPQRDPAFLVRQQKQLGVPDDYLRMWQSVFRSDGNKYPWISEGFQWLANGDFFYLGWLNGGGKRILLARKVSNNTGQVWDVWTVYQNRGDDTLLCLSSDEKVLSWAHQEPPARKTKDNKDTPEKPQLWQFVTADFDATKPDISNLIRTDLPEEPASISWDSKNKRWLIVSKKNNLLWIEKKGDKLTTTKVLLSLTWNDSKLRPTSAAVSPDGSQVALAAELEKPMEYSKTQCVVRSMIFNWDGKSTSVKPFYDPSVNDVPRYTYPATNSTWAKIEGNLKGLGLQDTVDPDFIESSSGSPKAVTQ